MPKVRFSDFVDWLEGEIEKGNLKQADIANTGLVSRSAVSLLFSRTTKSLSFEMCEAISEAMKIPLEDVYRKAGLLPSKPCEDDRWIRQMIFKLSRVPTSMRDVVSKTVDAFIPNDHNN